MKGLSGTAERVCERRGSERMGERARERERGRERERLSLPFALEHRQIESPQH